ncbi:metallothiol transferase fosB [Hibiscus syriacus]|uniref:Metallothiol transferase fosB n=1 Tax=Hibiscus syriacus TaxID=106335 RepID=A0A6A2XK24_HIBSY|nr:metallothiol transferase fosB [Hibiscus syriacus]
MEGLQRSTTSFRRQGSSGLVWDDKVLSGDLNRMKAVNNNPENKQSRGSSEGIMRRSRSDGGSDGRMYRTTKAASPSIDPPSPKVSGCGFCGVFGKPDAVKKRRSNKRNS